MASKVIRQTYKGGAHKMYFFLQVLRNVTGSVTLPRHARLRSRFLTLFQQGYAMRHQLTSSVLAFAVLASLLGCSNKARDENSWYKPPNIITRADIPDQGEAVAFGVSEVKPPLTGRHAIVNIAKTNVTEINPWQYAITVDLKDGKELKQIHLYSEILRLEGKASEVTGDSDKDNKLRLAHLSRAKMYRDMLQDAIIGVSNTVGSAHVATILRVEDSINLYTGVLDLAFDAASVIATPPGMKTLFAALSGIAGGTRALVNQEVYNNFIGPAIVKAIHKERLEALAKILESRKKSIHEYNVEQAIADAVAYHETWSFYLGMQSLVEAGQKRLSEETATIQARVDKALGQRDPRSVIEELKTQINQLPSALQTTVYTMAGTEIAKSGFAAPFAGITDEATFNAALSQVTDPSNLQTIANRLEAAYNLNRP